MGHRHVLSATLAAVTLAGVLTSCMKEEAAPPPPPPATASEATPPPPPPPPEPPVLLPPPTAAIPGDKLKLSQPPRPKPVYNAWFEFAETRKPVQFLRPAARHLLDFWIGPRDKQSLIGQAPNPEITSTRGTKRLRVMMACDFCSSTGTTQAEMTFDGSTQTSNRVAFEFTPGATPPEQSNRTMQVSVYDRDTGRLYDRVKIPAKVSSEAAPAPTMAIARTMTGVDAKDAVRPDILMSVTEEDGKGVTITITPVSPRAKGAIGALVLDAHGDSVPFHTGPLQQYLAGLAGAQFARVSALTLQGDLAQALNRGGAIPPVTAASHESSALSDSESAAVANLFAGIGKTLYRALFCRHESDALCQATRKLEGIGSQDQPLRISITTDTLSLPWQYLHPSGDTSVDAKRFWGMKYILSFRRGVDGSPPPLAARAKGANKIVFARYALTSDPSYGYATQQIDQIRQLPVNATDLVVVRSRDELMNAAGGPARNQISALIAYLHAHSAAALVNTPTGPAYAMSASGPELMFADKDTLPSSQLATLSGTTTDDRYFGKGPLVILNACETNPSGIAFPQASFTDTLFQLGAEGVIATEVSVWIPFGHLMATTLLRNLSQGMGADEALTRARVEIYDATHNPLGLLYAYYGEPGVQLIH